MKALDKLSLHNLAREAKQRMKSGYWINNNINSKNNVENNVEIYYRNRNRSENIYSINYDNDTYEKVKKILSSDEYISNPLARLIDSDYCDSLSGSNKFKYISEISEKFKKMKQKYYLEELGIILK